MLIKEIFSQILQGNSKNVLAYAYIWCNKNDPDLYGEWDFEVIFFKDSSLFDLFNLHTICGIFNASIQYIITDDRSFLPR